MRRVGQPVDTRNMLANPEDELFEDDEVIARDLERILEDDEAAMIFNATWNPAKTPDRTIPPQIGNKEELFVEEAIRASDADNLKLMVNTLGGSVQSSYNIADMVSRGYDDIEVYVPKEAKSGGTLLSFAGDRIVLGFNGELGPLDPQYRDGDSMRSVNQGLRKFEELDQQFSENRKEDMPYTKRVLAEDFDPEELQRWQDMRYHMKEKAQEIISRNDNIRNHRAAQITEPLTEKHRSHSDPIKYRDLTEDSDYDCIPNEVILNEDDRPEEMAVMRDWFKHYLPAKTSDHVVRFYE